MKNNNTPGTSFVWKRFAARLVDQFLVWYILLYFVEFMFGPIGSYESMLILFAIAEVIYMPIEACQLFFFRRTIGKAIFQLVIIDSDDGNTFLFFLRRSFLVWWRGQAAGIPVFTIVAMGIAYTRFVDTGSTSWDDELGTKVVPNYS